MSPSSTYMPSSSTYMSPSSTYFNIHSFKCAYLSNDGEIVTIFESEKIYLLYKIFNKLASSDKMFFNMTAVENCDFIDKPRQEIPFKPRARSTFGPGTVITLAKPKLY